MLKNKTTSPQKSPSQIDKGHTKFKASFHQGTPYLKRIIQADPIQKSRFQCIACKGKKLQPFDGFCENLKVHLQSKNHSKTIENTQEEASGKLH